MTLQLYRPVVSKRITQGWGENRACVWPDRRITGTKTVCPPGSQSFYRSVNMLGHNGIDIATRTGEEVFHAADFDGWWRSEVDSMGGIGVDIVSHERIFFKGEIPKEIKSTAISVPDGFTHYVKIRYWHLKAPVGHERKPVTTGTVIGLAGNTGASSGPHLHWAPKWCFEDGRGVGNNNGYNGAFDPTPFYNHTYHAKEHMQLLNIQPMPLTVHEIKDMHAQLTLAQRLLNSIKS